jgi:AcrR family transcriptional regulator
MAIENGLRERKKTKTRLDIVRAATQLFVTRGFDATTMDDIADAAEVSRSTLFRYFGNKEAMVFPHQDERLGVFIEIVTKPQANESPFATVRRGLLHLAEVFYASREELSVQQKIVSSSPYLTARELAFYDEWERAIRIAVVDPYAGSADQASRAKVASSAIFATVRTAMTEWLQDGCRENLIEKARRVLELMEEGLEGLAPFLLHDRQGGTQ